MAAVSAEEAGEGGAEASPTPSPGNGAGVAGVAKPLGPGLARHARQSKGGRANMMARPPQADPQAVQEMIMRREPSKVDEFNLSIVNSPTWGQSS
jgi:hypothetical protein